MKSDKKDLFYGKARDYDKGKAQIDNVTNIANLILTEIKYDKNQSILDFGSGTGLLLSKVAPYVGKITAVDISKSMNDVLDEKRSMIDCEIDIVEIDITKNKLNQKFDGILSSMTIHHLKDTLNLFESFYELLNNGGTIALADLDKENGTFHKSNKGVYHFGFDREDFLNTAKKAGFKNLKIQTVGVVEKPYGSYGVFLLTGIK